MAAVSEHLELRAGRLAVDLAPAIGGSIARFQIDGIDVMRPLSDASRKAGNVLGVASFPMIPFANRIGGNAFEFEGQRYEFAANNPPEIYHVHGTAWHRPWTAEQAGKASAVLSLEVADPSSYSYRAEQRFTLTDAGLELVTRVTNTGERTMPFGFGHHPWFDRDADTTVQFRARTFHLNEPEGMIGQRITLPPDVSFDTTQPLPRYWRCSDYGGWDGSATVSFPSRGAGITMKGDAPYRHVMFYADPALNVFCVEPQTNASGAFNRPEGFGDAEDGVIVLAPGESTEGTLRFEPFRI
ncbi:aldose 1-epimerase [Devosia sp. ZB163]|uniref:aldose 1-epimerase n=1 Tax=Devosia sp. ZB163 TaxID=3025938 RepID=UPI0023606B44|nr:aldose 1-epimerase [Devosia sp. ZB163]MDC9826341.1 aldose 1-epimerase [Devosia sp. ZB163]